MEPRPTVLVHLLSSRYQSVCDYYSKWRSVAMATEQVRASNCDIGSFEFQAITKSTDGGVGWAPLPFPSPPPPPPPKHTLPQAAVTKLYKHSPLPLPGKERCGRGGGRGEEDRVTRTLFVLVIAGSTPGGRPPPDGARNEGNGSFQSIGFWIDSSRRLPLGYQLLETWQS